MYLFTQSDPLQNDDPSLKHVRVNIFWFRQRRDNLT